MEKSLSLKYAEAITAINPNWNGTIEEEQNTNTEEGMIINWGDIEEISLADIRAKVSEMETAEANEATAKADLKASAKAKLIAGEALTEEEADTIVL
jgi:hypothetical protein